MQEGYGDEGRFLWEEVVDREDGEDLIFYSKGGLGYFRGIFTLKREFQLKKVLKFLGKSLKLRVRNKIKKYMKNGLTLKNI